ncbi:MAG: pyridoxal phosphate-dependent aminotransferase, partial [Phycisphaerales bacterium]|nr:pyridoxal phosphate-dependent aminotransferase [Phycisphaerales bacterium]
MTTQTHLSLSRRVSTLKPSITVSLNNRAKAMKAAGVDVLGFAAGEPDFDTPQPIKDAAIKAMLDGQTKYTPTLGDMVTRECVANKLVTENGIAGLTGEHVAIGCGGKHVLYSSIQCLFDFPAPGEDHWEMLLPTPAWVSYRPICELSGGKVREIDAGPGADFKISAAQLQDAITPRSRLLILNSPSNPCGTMYSEAELRALAKVIYEGLDIAPNLVVLTDEIYEKIVYGDDAHFSIGSIPEIADRVITLNGMSKAYAMTGWRIGYAAMPGEFGKKFIKAIGTLQGQMTTNITSFNYAAIRCALTDASVAGTVEEMRVAFASRAKLIMKRLAEIPGITCPTPTGAFYVFPDVSSLFGKTTPKGVKITDAPSLSEAMLDEAHIAFVPGDDFGGCGGNHVRISFACSDEQINAGMDRFKNFVESLN